MTSRNLTNRFSTYSGAPSLHPSIAPTTASSAAMSHLPVDSARNTMTAPPVDAEKLAAINRSPSTTSSRDARSADMDSWAAAIDRMQDRRLDQQRFEVSGKKSEEISMNAFSAKVARALSRRMLGQDAVFTRRGNSLSEKREIGISAK